MNQLEYDIIKGTLDQVKETVNKLVKTGEWEALGGIVPTGIMLRLAGNGRLEPLWSHAPQHQDVTEFVQSVVRVRSDIAIKQFPELDDVFYLDQADNDIWLIKRGVDVRLYAGVNKQAAVDLIERLNIHENVKIEVRKGNVCVKWDGGTSWDVEIEDCCG